MMNSEQKHDLYMFNKETIESIEGAMMDSEIDTDLLLNIMDRIALTLDKVIDALPEKGSMDGY